MKYKQQKAEEKKKLMKIITKELQEQDAVSTTKKVKKVAKQILLKIFYINFKVIKEYPDKKAFLWCLRSIDKNFYRVDPVFLKEIQQELKTMFDYFRQQCTLSLPDKLRRELAVLNVIIKIS